MSLLGGFEKLRYGFGVGFRQGPLKLLQIGDEHTQRFPQVTPIGHGDVAPHLRRTGGNARRIAKAVGA